MLASRATRAVVEESENSLNPLASVQHGAVNQSSYILVEKFHEYEGLNPLSIELLAIAALLTDDGRSKPFCKSLEIYSELLLPNCSCRLLL